jgi:possible acetyltransferase
MQIRKAKPEDLAQIMPLYEKAREFMAKNGNPSQWGKNNPPKALILQDIAEGSLYVGEEEEIELVFHFHVGEEPNYKEIYQGAWHKDEAYGVIHRVVSSGKIPGLAQLCFQFCKEQHPYLRIDTHENNQVMKRAIHRFGFQYCGEVIVGDGTKRLAYDYSPEV